MRMWLGLCLASLPLASGELTQVTVSATGEELWVELPPLSLTGRRLSTTAPPPPPTHNASTQKKKKKVCEAVVSGGGDGDDHAAPAHGDHTDGLFFLFVVSCTLGFLWRKLETILSHMHFNRKVCKCGSFTLFPYTVLLLFSGMAIGWIHRYWLCEANDGAGILDAFGGLGHSINKWRTINPYKALYMPGVSNVGSKMLDLAVPSLATRTPAAHEVGDLRFPAGVVLWGGVRGDRAWADRCPRNYATPCCLANEAGACANEATVTQAAIQCLRSSPPSR